MKKEIFIPAMFLLFLTSITSLPAQQTFKTTKTSVIGYLEYLPQDYNTNSNKYPIVIFLHGNGERGVTSTDPAVLSTTIQSVAKLGPPMHVKNGYQFPFILISPQLKNSYSTWPSSYVKEVIEHVKTYLRIDEQRIYITGLSLGGGGAWVAAQDLPELFAAVAPVCGGYNSPSKACNLASENLPVWAFHGDADTVVPLSRSSLMVNAINACTPTPSPLGKLTVYAGVGHSAWTKAYTTDHTYHNPNVYEWMLSFRNTINKGNRIPTANAGVDKTIYHPQGATLVGSAVDSDGSVSSYSWTQIGGPSEAVLTSALTNTLSISNLSIGAYDFKLTVKDNSGNVDSDYIRVNVQEPPPNVAPVASAGVDRSITLPISSIALSGTGVDSDGTVVSYNWSKVSGSTAQLSGATSSKLTVSGMVQGNYVFRLTVKDDKGATHADDVNVSVLAASTINVSPIANAGVDKSVYLPSTSTVLYGSATDSDGTIRYYKWSKISGPSANTYGVSTSTLQISGMKIGTYLFRLTVTDNKGGIGTDEVQVTVKDGMVTATAVVDSSVAPSLDNVNDGETVLGKNTLANLEDATVLIFNENGDQLFSGTWDERTSERVFEKSGLYVYSVIKKGRKVDMGKMYVVH